MAETALATREGSEGVALPALRNPPAGILSPSMMRIPFPESRPR